MTKGQGKSTSISTSNVKLSEKLGSNFTVLEDISEESDILESIEILKQKTRNIPGPNTKGGQAHEKGKNKGIRERRPSPIRELEREALVMEA